MVISHTTTANTLEDGNDKVVAHEVITVLIHTLQQPYLAGITYSPSLFGCTQFILIYLNLFDTIMYRYYIVHYSRRGISYVSAGSG